MSNFCPETGTLEEWNAAYYRLEDYLRAHLVINKVHQSQIILRILQRAAARHRENPEASPVTLSMQEAHEAIDQWFRLLLGGRPIPPQRIGVAGRLAMYLSDAPARNPRVLLDMEDIPDELIRSMQNASLQAGPDLQISSMVPRPVDEAGEDETPPMRPEHIAGAVLAAVCFVLAISAAFIIL